MEYRYGSHTVYSHGLVGYLIPVRLDGVQSSWHEHLQDVLTGMTLSQESLDQLQQPV